MPTIFSHPAVPIAAAAVLGRQQIGWRLIAAGVIASMVPDLDVLAFRLGIAYGHELGHRGFSHSLAFALGLGVLAAILAQSMRSRPVVAGLFVFASRASHGLLDMCTNGGHGIAYFWPFSDERYFLPFRVIEVSTLNVRRFFGPAGAAVMLSELRWVWLPAAIVGVVGYALRRKNGASRETHPK